MDFRCGTRMSFRQVRKPHIKNRVVTTDSAARWLVEEVGVKVPGDNVVPLGISGIGLHFLGCAGTERNRTGHPSSASIIPSPTSRGPGFLQKIIDYLQYKIVI